MPFTFSHPVIVLPLKKINKNWFSLTGLIIGSLMPDFEYFIHMRLQNVYGHSIFGIFWFCLPLGLLCCFVFHNIVRNDLFRNLPSFLKSRLIIYCEFCWNKYFLKNWFIVILSIIIGSFSHILWDNFTHSYGYFVKLIPLLSYEIYFRNFIIPIYKILQHSGTIIGAIIIFFIILRFPRYENKDNIKFSISYWGMIFLITNVSLIINLINGLNIKYYGNIIVIIISGFLLSIIIVPIVYKIKHLVLRITNG